MLRAEVCCSDHILVQQGQAVGDERHVWQSSPVPGLDLVYILVSSHYWSLLETF